MHYVGKIYRPWIEAESVLIQTTLGCSNNQCTFCTMFDDKRFKVRDIEGIFQDIYPLSFKMQNSASHEVNRF